MILKCNTEQFRSTYSQQETPVPLNDEPLLSSKFITPSPPIHCVPPCALPGVQQLQRHHTRQDYSRSIQETLKKCCYIKCHIGFIKLWKYYSSPLSGTPLEPAVATGYLHLQFYLYWAINSGEPHAYAKFHSKIYISCVSSVLEPTKWDWNIESAKRRLLSSLDFHSELSTRRALFYYSFIGEILFGSSKQNTVHIDSPHQVT